MNGTKIKLWYIQDKPQSRAYSKVPKSRHPVASDIIYVPFSIIEHTHKQPADGDEWPVHVVTVPDWFVSKNNL
jgi:hypothetical protein